MNQYMFSSEVELGKFLVSSVSDIIQYAYQAILETTLSYDLHTSPSGIKVLAFNCSSNHTTPVNGEFDLVSSEKIQVIDFIPTKVNPKFSINKAAVELFDDLSNDLKLKDLENQHLKTPLIITGSGLGGYLAILSTLRLQRAVDVEESNGSKNTKRPICITFGSPLVGDVAFQHTISERPQWKSSFLNVVAKKDPVASFFTSKTPYKPIGTYLICTESGGHTAFEDQDSVLAVLDAMASSNVGNMEIYNYTNVLSSIRKKVLYRGVSEFGDFNLNSLRAGITLQFKEVGVLEDISNDLIGEMERKKAKMIRNKKNVYEPTKKLNDMKISLTVIESYMKSRKLKGGYYDSYKGPRFREEITDQQRILTHQRKLNQYYEKFVEEKDLMPQKEGAKLRKRWLYSGNNYRRIVEPLDIAEYYKEGNTKYIEKRPDHYKLLEIWLNEDMKDLKPRGPKTKAASLTEDSCFWAHVEEALISLNKLRNGGLSNNAADIEQKLKEFEDKVMCAINDYAVSPEIFLNGSSFLKWWNEYKEYKGCSYASDFTEYMNNKKYESYQ